MALEIWDKIRRKVIAMLRQKTAELTKATKDVRITRAIGAGAGLVGGVIAIGSFVLVPFTLGGSLLLSAIGAGLATIGGVTSIGATVVIKMIESSVMNKTNQLLAVGNQLTQTMQGLLELLEGEAAKLAVQNPGTSKEEWLFGIIRSGGTALRVGTMGVRGAVVAASSGGMGVLEGGLAVAQVAAGSSIAVAAAGGVVNVLLLPISIVDLTVNVYALAAKKKTNAIIELERVIDQLEKNWKITNDYISGYK